MNEKTTQDTDLPWWKKTTVYQIYPRSFMDSNGDGIGDLRGIISKLDYLQDLGIETIWFSPFYTSPQADFGYDIADYRNVAPEYGTMADVEELIDQIHHRNMKIVLDMVMNHTSDQHPWFLASKSSKDNPKRDWYIWRDGRKPKGKAPPNNWRAMPGGSGWKYDPTTDQWFFHEFLDFQPDLNYRNPEVKKEMFDTVRFWCNKKVDGFRLDIINAIYEDAEFRDNPFSWKMIPSDEDPTILFRSSVMTLNHPDTFKFTKELRAVIEEFQNPPRYLVGEVNGSTKLIKQYCGEKADGLNSVFIFKSLGAKLTAPVFRGLIEEYERDFPEPFIPTWVFANHDRFRRISRLDNDIQKAKLNTALQLTVRGVPYIYYGEEIGIPQAQFDFSKTKDAVAFNFMWVPRWALKIAWRTIHESLNRDECRTPMQWNASITAGFTKEGIKPWLPLSTKPDKINVESESKDTESLFQCYRRFLRARKITPALNAGACRLLDVAQPKFLLAYERFIPKNEAETRHYVYLNFSNQVLDKIAIPKPNPKLLVSTKAVSNACGKDTITLDPWEGIVFN